MGTLSEACRNLELGTLSKVMKRNSHEEEQGGCIPEWLR